MVCGEKSNLPLQIEDRYYAETQEKILPKQEEWHLRSPAKSVDCIYLGHRIFLLPTYRLLTYITQSVISVDSDNILTLLVFTLFVLVNGPYIFSIIFWFKKFLVRFFICI